MTKPQRGVFALVGDLEAVWSDALAEDAEGLADGGERIVLVPHLAAVELVALRGRAVELCLFADGRGGGLSAGLDGVGMEGHVDFL